MIEEVQLLTGELSERAELDDTPHVAFMEKRQNKEIPREGFPQPSAIPSFFTRPRMFE